MDQVRNSKTEMTTLGVENEKSSEEEQVECTSSDGAKVEQPSDPEISPTSRVTPNIGMACLKMSNRKVKKTKQEKSSEDQYEVAQEQVACSSSDGFKADIPVHPESSPALNADLDGYEKSEKPVLPCLSSDPFYAERLPAPESCPTSTSSQNVEMTYFRKANETEEHLEIVDDVKTMKASSDVNLVGGYKESKKTVPCRSSDEFNVEWPLVPESSSAFGSTKNINVKMTYKKGEEKVDMNRYMILDDDLKRREDLGRYKSLSVPCSSAGRGNELSPAREGDSASGANSAAETLLNTDDEYDDVLIENENSDQDEYEEPDEVHSGHPSVPPSVGYEEPDVINSEQPPTPGSNRSPSVTSATTSFYQELK